MVDISIVIPVYNEEKILQKMSDRLMPVMEKLGRSYEVIYTNDGSNDDSINILHTLYQKHPQHVRIIDFKRNFGQHMAIMASFEKSHGNVVINLDADLQNPPEEIPKLIKAFDAGHDVVGSFRLDRQDDAWRDYGSRFANWVRGWMTGIEMKDQGCMFRAYSRDIVEEVVRGGEANTFIPALAWRLATNPTEIGLVHDARAEGSSKYGIYELIRVSLDLVTSFSLMPIQIVTVFGIVVSFSSFMLVLYMIGRRLIIGPEAEGLFTLLAIVIFLISVAIMGIGIIGEYVGRTYQQVSSRPRYLIREIIEDRKKDQK